MNFLLYTSVLVGFVMATQGARIARQMPQCQDATSLSVAGCIAGLCGSNYVCINGLCCPKPTCADGSEAVAACINGLCGNGLVCTRGNVCCVGGTSASCNFVATPSQRCTAGMCPTGQVCSLDGYCCPEGSIRSGAPLIGRRSLL